MRTASLPGECLTRTKSRHPTVTVRKASVEDLDAILDIGLAALPHDPQWHYRFPYRHEFPEDTRDFTRARYKEFLEDGEKQWCVMVAESADAQHPRGAKPVAFAIWEIVNIRKHFGFCTPSKTSTNTSTPRTAPSVKRRRDGHAQRMQAWNKTTSWSKQRIFDDIYGTGHFHLQILATHPSYRKRGAATALCNVGLAAATRLNMVVSVFASPMGRRLYRQLGFCYVNEVRIQVEGEDQFVILTAMLYVPDVPAFPRYDFWSPNSAMTT
ncbi:acyl-CoA N-acyltransferase [Aulographum hederae CBS 113979]|uniref:Acyl-CoA N-acyltransferase n=1 Tax=Aulographum hederae CBS 113979 TaxID=1176131 RepID=A0A6G1H0D1_9PEZI|nr:acyl-CoA N-acyltransferase [Aulographum hederae CBS 113979]